MGLCRYSGSLGLPNARRLKAFEEGTAIACNRRSRPSAAEGGAEMCAGACAKQARALISDLMFRCNRRTPRVGSQRAPRRHSCAKRSLSQRQAGALKKRLVPGPLVLLGRGCSPLKQAGPPSRRSFCLSAPYVIISRVR